MIKQLLHEAQAMPVVKRERADSWGQELLQPSQSKPPPAVSQRPPLATVISCVAARPRREKPPLGSKSSIMPTHSLELRVSLAEYSLVLIFKLTGLSSAVPS